MPEVWRIITSINKSLLPLVKEDSSYSDVSPDLFGADFAKRSKDFLDQVKALRSSTPSNDYKKSLFQKLRPILGEDRSQLPRWCLQLIQSPKRQESWRRPTGPTGQQKIEQSICFPNALITKECLINTIQNILGLQVSLPWQLQVQLEGWHISPKFGKNITEDQLILSTVKGYRIEFHTMPYQAYEPHPLRFNQEQQLLVEQEVNKLQDKGAVTLMKGSPQGRFISTLFLVPKKGWWSGDQSSTWNAWMHLWCPHTSKWKAYRPSRALWNKGTG